MGADPNGPDSFENPGSPEGASPPRDGTPPRGRRWLGRGLDVALWVAVVAVLAWRFGPQVGAALGLGASREPAPDFTVRTLDGDSLRLSDLRGQVVLLNFWATWCPPCRLEMPGFQRVWESYHDRGVVIIGLSVDRGVRADVERWVRERGITYPIAFATGRIADAYGGAGTLPTSVLIGRDGRIMHRVEGFYAEPALRAALRRLLDHPALEDHDGGRWTMRDAGGEPIATTSSKSLEGLEVTPRDRRRGYAGAGAEAPER